MGMINYEILNPEENMEKKRLEPALKMLWKDIFNDSDAYIDLVYSVYLRSMLAGAAFNEYGDLIASLTAIPYRFYPEISGWYFCGLSTKKEYRGQGIIKKLMQMAEEQLKSRGAEFIFLVPASERLQTYYSRLGYNYGIGKVRAYIDRNQAIANNTVSISSSRICVDPACPAELRPTSVVDSDDLSLKKYHNEMPNENGSDKVLLSLTNFLRKCEQERCEELITEGINCIQHTIVDWETVIREVEVSDGAVYFLHDSSNLVKAAGLGYFSKEGHYVVKHIAGCPDMVVRMIERITLSFRVCLELPDISCTYFKEIMKKVPVSEIENEPYTMVKDLKDKNTLKNENLKFAAKDKSIQKYPILTKDRVEKQNRQFDTLKFDICPVMADMLLD